MMLNNGRSLGKCAYLRDLLLLCLLYRDLAALSFTQFEGLDGYRRAGHVLQQKQP